MLLPVTAAHAQGSDWGGGDTINDDDYTESGGGSDESGIYSEVEFSNSAGSSEPPGTAPAVVDWTPPACWYEPRTVEWTRTYVTNMLQSYAQMPEEDIGSSRERLTDHYMNGNPYEDFNSDAEEEGRFWFGVANPERRDDPEAFSCAGLAEWAPLGEGPENQPLAVDAELLAEAAYEWLPLPETEISMNPDVDGPQTVNLASWIWQDTADVGEVSATAELESVGLSATTVATPSALRIDPGTEDAVLHPSGGECTINADGTIGEPYTEDRAEDEPPCGVTYQRATTGGEPYQLTATITWSVTWTGTGTPDPQPLPDAVLETTHDITVEEIQTIIR